jgi:stage IV sporulation protein FB
MSWSFPIGTVKGTVIRIHLTFLLFLVWIGVSHYAQGGQRAAVEGVLFISLLFACVLLHEFGHVFAARRYGVQTPDITLLPIGGVARLERIPEKPAEELVVALAGPAVNVVIAALLFLALGGLPAMGDGTQVHNPGVDLLGRLAWVNISLVVFNLIPAFPMDGGRVLRAVLAYRLGYARGTRIAAGIGQAVAFALGLLGLFGNPLLIFIALFVYMGAAAEASAAQMREASRGMIASDAAETRFEGLPSNATVEDAVERLLSTSQHDFPVVDGSGRLRGVVTRDDLAELAVDEMLDIEGMDAEHAGKLIMAARQHWFE